VVPYPPRSPRLDVLTLSLGIDVSATRGLDVVTLDELRRVVEVRRRQSPDDLAALLAAVRPDVVAIDSPPAWGTSGRSRPAERAVRRLGMGIFATPSDPAVFDHPFYAWMTVGFAAFAAAAVAGYPYFRGTGAVAGHALEVYPHAAALRLGGDPAVGTKRVWRRHALETTGVDTSGLRSVDALDAALAALTGLLALAGGCELLGDETDGVIVLPAVGPERFELSCRSTWT
jgi:predicted nuclease with RNAse H fold